MYINTYIPMLNGNGTNLFGQVEIKKRDIEKGDPRIEIDTYESFASIQHGDLTLYLDNCYDMKCNLAAGVHKFFDILVMQLSQQNGRKCKIPNPAVELSLVGYMGMSGIPATKSSMDCTRKIVKDYLDMFSRISMTWKERSGKKIIRYQRQKLFDTCTFENGMIKGVFSTEMAQYLIGHGYIMQYPSSLLKLDDRKSTAYYIGKKLAFHHGLESNVYYQRNNCISISSLLDAVPSINNNRDPSHWKRNVKGVFEDAMETLVSAGIITHWQYSLGQGRLIMDVSSAASTYKNFSKLYINFEINNFPLPELKVRKHLAAV